LTAPEASPLTICRSATTSSADLVEAGRVTVGADPAGRPPDKAYDGYVTIT